MDGPETFALMRSLLGRWVRVTLDRGHYPDNNTAHIATGRLLAIADSGEIAVEAEDGFVHYCWPALDIEEIPEP